MIYRLNFPTLYEWSNNNSVNSKILEEKGVNIWKGNTSKEFIEKCNLIISSRI